jgi:hypothetical protein
MIKRKGIIENGIKRKKIRVGFRGADAVAYDEQARGISSYGRETFKFSVGERV